MGLVFPSREVGAPVKPVSSERARTELSPHNRAFLRKIGFIVKS